MTQATVPDLMQMYYGDIEENRILLETLTSLLENETQCIGARCSEVLY